MPPSRQYAFNKEAFCLKNFRHQLVGERNVLMGHRGLVEFPRQLLLWTHLNPALQSLTLFKTSMVYFENKLSKDLSRYPKTIFFVESKCILQLQYLLPIFLCSMNKVNNFLKPFWFRDFSFKQPFLICWLTSCLWGTAQLDTVTHCMRLLHSFGVLVSTAVLSGLIVAAPKAWWLFIKDVLASLC